MTSHRHRNEAEKAAIRATRRAHRLSQRAINRAVRSKRRRMRGRNFYRDRRNARFLGVCAGVAEYLGFPTWKVRATAAAGLLFIPQITIPMYFVAYFMMDDKPLYRELTDRYSDLDEPVEEAEYVEKESLISDPGEGQTQSKTKKLRAAKEMFADIEHRLRMMETHVTSSQFELNRELNKISGTS